MTLGKYLAILERMRPQVERFSRRSWPGLHEEIASLTHNGLDSVLLFPVESANTKAILSFMVYLRQHGFPSPLLDWTSDPYRAAFFAFSGVEEGAREVAIYVFREWAGPMGECRRDREATAMGFGHHIRNTSPRHAKQLAQYTWCVKKSSSGKCLDYYVFSDHEEAVNLPGFQMKDGVCIDVERAQNIVRKYTLPASERRKVLASLAQRRISKCTLFGRSTDDLLEDLWNGLVLDSVI
jgi:hypothetical protein